MFKKNYLNLIFLFCAIHILFGCSLWPKTKTEKIAIQYPEELDAVNQMIVDKKTDDAKIKIDDYLNKSENIHWFGHAYFLKAFLYEIDGNYDQSIEEYRSAIQHSANYNSRVEAKALYNLSFVYERVQNMTKLATTLVDLMKRREFFDSLTARVEIPARLAATYAYLGKQKEAYIFHREAAAHFDELVRRNSFNASKSEISKSLYYLGLAVYVKADDDFKALMGKVGPGQKYFLASAEASRGEWAEKSTNQLLDNYNRVWKLILDYKPKGYGNDKLAIKKQTHMKQLEMAADLYDLTYRLQAEEFPMGHVNQRSKALMDKLKKWQSKIENFALQLDLGPEQIRSKPVKQRRLMKVIEEPKEEVRINKETTKAKDESKKSEKNEKLIRLPEKNERDPNL